MFKLSEEDEKMLNEFNIAIIAERSEVLYKYVVFLDDELDKLEKINRDEKDENFRQILINKKEKISIELHDRFLSNCC